MNYNGSERMEIEDKFKNYEKSKLGNFYVVSSIGIPHPYCITPKHLIKGEMYLNIEAAEKQGAVCNTCRHLVREKKQDRILTYKEHKQGLLICCEIDPKTSEELKEYLNDLVASEPTIKKEYEGFAFIDSFSKKAKGFSNFEELQNKIRTIQKVDDYIKVNGVTYTQDHYDSEGKQITYANKKYQYGFEILTKDRYKLGFKDAVVNKIYNAVLRNDIVYKE